ncbi:hypothetical protein EX30DRAFT_56764 [Ascodesmis nigricans]|uniref:Secreted protein n=1 Tax=Ascodesmis nigricans TaxID=341454 RepID=A0A4S2MUN2_9PEZI|nr:hypothetical protein EX30DRAFT_56764 [Ascodesmis nigricans]
MSHVGPPLASSHVLMLVVVTHSQTSVSHSISPTVSPSRTTPGMAYSYSTPSLSARHGQGLYVHTIGKEDKARKPWQGMAQRRCLPQASLIAAGIMIDSDIQYLHLLCFHRIFEAAAMSAHTAV